MKRTFHLAFGLFALSIMSTLGQPAPLPAPAPAPPPAGNYQTRLQNIIERANPPQNQPPALAKFNLDFPGGTPKELIAAIEKAMGKPINVIIPDEDAATKLPPLKLNEITFSQLSDTLRVGSTKTEMVWLLNANGSRYNQMVETGYYFKTTDDQPTDDSVWFFRVTKKPEQPPQPPVKKVCQFYPLALYLSRGFTVDDITTAIQTGWKMAGLAPTPDLNYHKETKLLIAYGEPAQLETIGQVLNALPQTKEDYNGLWNQMKQLQQQVDQLTKKISPPPLPTGTVEIK